MRHPRGRVYILGFALLFILPLQAGTSGMHTRTSDKGYFTIRYRPEVVPIPAYASHYWLITVSDRDNNPVEGAEIVFGARMMQEGIPMGTIPSVKDLGGGNYIANGVKFLGPGLWTIFIDVRKDGITDGIRFQEWVGR